MLRQSDVFSSLLHQVAQRAHATPTYFGQGIVVSFAAHAVAAGGYSLYLICAAWLSHADLPVWMPPQSGVRSRPQASSHAIMIEAAFATPARDDHESVTMQVTPTQKLEPAPPLDAQETPVQRPADAKENEKRLADRRSTPTLPESLGDARDANALPLARQEVEQDAIAAQVKPPRSASVPKRGHGVAIATVTSVPSTAARESHGAETDALPQTVYSPEPEYPDAQYAARIGGRLKIRIHLDRRGHVVAASIYRSSGVPAFDQAAIRAVRQWRFEPASPKRPTVRDLVVPIRFIPPK